MTQSVSSSNVAYLLTLLRLGATEHPVSTSNIATELKVRAPSVVGALHRLHRDKLAVVSPRLGTVLTRAGAKLSKHLYRRHALAEVLVYRVLNVAWPEVHEEATRLQAAVSPRLEAAMAELFDDACETPYGHPIPTLDGKLANRNLIRLVDLETGQGMTIREVDDLDTERLREYWRTGLKPGVTIRVMARLRDGTLRVSVGTLESDISLVSASGVRGEPTVASENQTTAKAVPRISALRHMKRAA